MKPAEFYPFIEAWWGAPFDDALIESIANAPSRHLKRLAVELTEDPIEFEDEAVANGRLRPIVPDEGLAIPLRLLLYSHEVLVDGGQFGWPMSTFRQLEEPDELARRLRVLRDIRPLIETGVLRVGVIRSRGRHPSALGDWENAAANSEDFELLRDVVQVAIREQYDLPTYVAETRDVQVVFAGMTGACGLARMGLGQTLATSELEQIVRGLLLKSTSVDGRQTQLSTLAALTVPDLSGKTPLLVRLRNDADEFAAWRESLGRALDLVVGLDGTDAAATKEASNVVSSELKAALASLKRSTDRSPALAALKTGAAGFALAGIGAGAGLAASGQPLVALASGAATESVAATGRYIRAIAERRRGKAVLDLAVLFDPSPN